MSVAARKQIKNEIKDLQSNPLYNISVTPNEKNMRRWGVTVVGPPNTPYENGEFILEIVLPNTYPNEGPNVTCVTKIYHMSINTKGKICIELLIDGWKPSNSMRDVLMDFYQLLEEPSVYDVLCDDIFKQYGEDREGHDETARQWTKKFATPAQSTQERTTNNDPEDEKQQVGNDNNNADAAQNGVNEKKESELDNVKMGKQVWLVVVPDIYVLVSDRTEKALKYGTDMYTVSEMAEKLSNLDKKDKINEIQAQAIEMGADETKFVEMILSMEENKEVGVDLTENKAAEVKDTLLFQFKLLLSKF